MSRARYAAVATETIIKIVDLYDPLNPTMSVTNDAEAVVEEVVSHYGNNRIFARDTEGQWDELLHENGVFKGFAPISKEDQSLI